MLSFQNNQESLHFSLLQEINSMSTPQFSQYQNVDCDDEPIPLNCTANVSLSLEPLALYTENPRCACQFFQSESLPPILANVCNEPSVIGALAQNYSMKTNANEMLTSTTTFGCPSTIGISRSGFLAAASSTCGPAVHDVVCSRGKVFYNLPGNVRFRKTIRSCIPMYLTASSKMDKSVIIDRIIDLTVIVDAINGSTRFLKYHSRTRTWSVMGYDQVRDKVGHALREAAYDMERENKIKSTRAPKRLTGW